MSYCRWCDYIPESVPDGVDVSREKQIDMYFNNESWFDYLKENNVLMSDVYVYDDIHGGITCHLINCETYNGNAEEMKYLLTQLKHDGFNISQSVIDALEDD